MIYILYGNDYKNKNIFLKKLCKDNNNIFFSGKNIKKEILLDYSMTVGLFGENPVVVIENLIKEGNINLSQEELSFLKDSKTVFIFNEDKISQLEIKKYTKFSNIKNFNQNILNQKSRIDVFSIANAYSFKDKMKAWVLYREAIESGVSPEEISGVIFWKIKMMLLSGAKLFSKEELKTNSSNIVSIYHNSHNGNIDFTIALEQFILSSLSK